MSTWVILNLATLIIKWDLEWENSCHIALVREKWSMMPSTYLQPHQLTRNLELQGKQLNNNPFSIICLFYKWETEAQISDKTRLCSWQMSCRIGTGKLISRAQVSTRSPFIPRETRPGLGGHWTGVRRTWDCGPSHGPRVCLSHSGLLFPLPLLMVSLSVVSTEWMLCSLNITWALQTEWEHSDC